VRYLFEGDDTLLSSLGSPFVVEGANNVFLETIKRGEDDSFGSNDYDWDKEGTTVTVVLRLYEAYGGHARARLRISGHLPVSRAYLTNLLEDHHDELNFINVEDSHGRDIALTLDFHGFEVKTVKLIIGCKIRQPTDEE
jgi:alpha-mannosidase